MADLRWKLGKLKREKLAAAEAKCKKLAASLQAAKQKATAEASTLLAAALQEHMKDEKGTADKLFEELKGSAGVVEAARMKDYLGKGKLANKLTSGQLSLALSRFPAGITRLSLSAM